MNNNFNNNNNYNNIQFLLTQNSDQKLVSINSIKNTLKICGEDKVGLILYLFQQCDKLEKDSIIQYLRIKTFEDLKIQDLKFQIF
jgi:hypothetical protein